CTHVSENLLLNASFSGTSIFHYVHIRSGSCAKCWRELVTLTCGGALFRCLSNWIPHNRSWRLQRVMWKSLPHPSITWSRISLTLQRQWLCGSQEKPMPDEHWCMKTVAAT